MSRWRIWWLAGLLALMPLALWAQSDPQPEAPDYAQWRTVAERAETAIAADRASDTALEALRGVLVDYRSQFDRARGVNANRIDTLQSQLDALGPVPEEGGEDPEIVLRRAQLSEQLSTLRAPVVAAQEAFTRAAGLIGEIDNIIRDRQAQAFLRLEPSPLNPANWAPALVSVTQFIRTLQLELINAWQNPVQIRELRSDLPLVMVLLALAVLLLVRGPGWSLRIGAYLRTLGGHGSGVWGFLISLGRIGFPLLGLYALTEAVFATGLIGLRGTLILDNLPYWGAILLGARWLCERLFPKSEDDVILAMPADNRAQARWLGSGLGVLFVLASLFEQIARIGALSDTELSVLIFPLIVLAGVLLFRLGVLLRDRPEPDDTGDDDNSLPESMRSTVLRLLGLAAIVVALVAPIMAGIGYATAARGLIYPAAESLALFGLVLVVQRFFADVYGYATGRGAEARDALVPVLIGFVLTLCAAPVLALIWGARVSDLTEVWTRFLTGFTVGETTISPVDFLAFALIFAVGYMLTRLIQSSLRQNVLPKTKIDIGGQNAIVSGTGYVGIFLAGLIAITGAGIDLSSLAIVAGALSVGIGFGLQNIVSNFVSGIILLIERPISEGDWIEVNGHMGYVRDISVRSTRIETFDRTDVIIPNGDLISGSVTNYTRGNTVGRVIVPVGVAYGTDPRRVEGILREVAQAHPMVVVRPPPTVVFQGFGADSLDFEIRAILRDVNWVLSVRSDMNYEIARRFAEEGIEIPFAQRDIWLRNPEALHPATPTAPAPPSPEEGTT